MIKSIAALEFELVTGVADAEVRWTCWQLIDGSNSCKSFFTVETECCPVVGRGRWRSCWKIENVDWPLVVRGKNFDLSLRVCEVDIIIITQLWSFLVFKYWNRYHVMKITDPIELDNIRSFHASLLLINYSTNTTTLLQSEISFTKDSSVSCKLNMHVKIMRWITPS